MQKPWIYIVHILVISCQLADPSLAAARVAAPTSSTFDLPLSYPFTAQALSNVGVGESSRSRHIGGIAGFSVLMDPPENAMHQDLGPYNTGTHIGTRESYGNQAIDVAHKEVVRALRTSPKTMTVRWDQGTLQVLSPSERTPLQTHLLNKLESALQKVASKTSTTFYFFDGAEKIQRFPTYGTDPRSLVSFDDAIIYAEAGSGGPALSAAEPSVYMTIEGLCDLSSKTLVLVLGEEITHAQEKTAGTRQHEVWNDNKWNVLRSVRLNFRMAQESRLTLQERLENLIPTHDRKILADILKGLDYELLRAAMVRRLNLEDRAFRDAWIKKWDESPKHALYSLAEGVTTSHHVSRGNPFIMKKFPEGVGRVPLSLLNKIILYVGSAAKTTFLLEWSYFPKVRFWLPVAVIGTAGTEKAVETAFLRTFVTDHDTEFNIERMGVHSDRTITRDLYKRMGPFHVYGRIPPSGEVGIGRSGVENKAGDLPGSNSYSFEEYSDDLYVGAVKEDGVPVSIHFPAPNIEIPFHRVILMNTKGMIIEVLESLYGLTQERFRLLAEGLRERLISEKASLWVVDLLTTQGRNDAAVLLMLASVNEFGKRITLPSKAYRGSYARIRLGQDGVVDYVNIWTPIAREINLFLKLVEIHFQDQRVRVVNTTMEILNPTDLLSGAKMAFAEKGQMRVTGIKINKQKDASWIATGGQKIRIPTSVAKALIPYRDAQVVYDPSQEQPVPIEVLVGRYSSQNPWDIQRHFIPLFSIRIVSGPKESHFVANELTVLPEIHAATVVRPVLERQTKTAS